MCIRDRIRTIPNELEALTKLKHLRLGYNRISGFRGNIYLMSSLQTLDLGHNRQGSRVCEVVGSMCTMLLRSCVWVRSLSLA